MWAKRSGVEETIQGFFFFFNLVKSKKEKGKKKFFLIHLFFHPQKMLAEHLLCTNFPKLN